MSFSITQDSTMEFFRTLAKSKGFSLIPLEGKRPVKNSPWKQYCDSGVEIDEGNFHGYNAGVCCGPASGVLVLDIDDPTTFELLKEASKWDLPTTYTVRTGGGGRHLYYRYPNDGSYYSSKSLKHPAWSGHTIFDIKGAGGYVVAPGSIHPDTGRPYTVELDQEIAQAPDWLKSYVLSGEVNKDILWTIPLPGEKAQGFIESLKLSASTASCILDGKPKGQRSEAIGKVIVALLGARYGEKVIRFVFENYPIGEKYREKEAGKHTWLSGEIARAENYIEREQKDFFSSKIQIDMEALEARVKKILDSSEPVGPYDTSSLPPVIEDYILSICDTTAAEPIAVTQSVLCTISAFMKNSHNIPEGVYFQKLYPNVWMLTIAPSGQFKTTALNKGASIAWQQESKIKNDLERLSNDNDEKAKESRMDLTKKKVLLPNRMTAEALLQHLSYGAGGMIICSEFGEWLKNLERTHNQGMKPLLTDLFDVPRQWSYRTTSGGLLVVEEPYITINGVSTLTWVRANIRASDIGSGFFARFLIFFPPQKQIIPPALPARSGKTTDGEQQVKQVLESLPPFQNYGFDPNSTDLFRSYHESLYKGIEGKDEKTREMLGPYQKRWSPYILKVAMILQPFINSKTDKLSTAALEGAKSVIDYAIKSTTYLFQNDLGETAQQRKHRKVQEYIARKGGKVKHATLQKSRVLNGGTREYEATIESLEAAGEIQITKANKKGDWIYTLSTESTE